MSPMHFYHIDIRKQFIDIFPKVRNICSLEQKNRKGLFLEPGATARYFLFKIWGVGSSATKSTVYKMMFIHYWAFPQARFIGQYGRINVSSCLVSKLDLGALDLLQGLVITHQYSVQINQIEPRFGSKPEFLGRSYSSQNGVLNNHFRKCILNHTVYQPKGMRNGHAAQSSMVERLKIFNEYFKIFISRWNGYIIKSGASPDSSHFFEKHRIGKNRLLPVCFRNDNPHCVLHKWRYSACEIQIKNKIFLFLQKRNEYFFKIIGGQDWTDGKREYIALCCVQFIFIPLDIPFTGIYIEQPD